MIKNFFSELKGNLLNLFCLFIFFFFLFFSYWLIKLFGSTTYYIEIIYNLLLAYDGTKQSPLSYKIDFLLTVINTPIFFSVIFFFIIKKIKDFFKNNNFRELFMVKLILNYKIYPFIGLCFFLIQFKFYDHFLEYSEFKDKAGLYNDPRTISFNNPTNKKNLILIYFESLEYGIENLQQESPIKLINEIEGKNIYDFKPASGATWSIAGVTSSMCGIPLHLSVGIDFFKKNQKKFYCVGDVLNRNGYSQNFFITVGQGFHGFGKFFTRQGYNVYDRFNIKAEKPDISNTGWGKGIQDDDFIDFIKNKIVEKHKKKELFNITFITTDTHHPFQSSRKCKIKVPKSKDINSKSIKAYKCTSLFINKFVKDLTDAGVMDNTVLIIMGDHLADGKVNKIKKNANRSVYFKINTKKKLIRKKMTHFDVAPTILDELGFMPENLSSFGFGKSLLSNNENYNYDIHYQNIMDPRIINDKYMVDLFKFEKPELNSEPNFLGRSRQN